MTAKELVAKVLDVAKNYKTVYMWGVFGAPVAESVISGKTRQYPSWYSAAKQALFRSLIGKGYFGFDCVNLIKGILWGWNGDINATYGGAKYASNGVPDTNADGMIKLCKDVSTDFRNILPGEVVWMPGHIGVYVGDGLAVECTPRWSNNVQLTAVGNIGKKAGYNTRTWTNRHYRITYDNRQQYARRNNRRIHQKLQVPKCYARNQALWAAIVHPQTLNLTRKSNSYCSWS